jgi:hypothetical protein
MNARLVAFVAVIGCVACGSPGSSERQAVILEPERIPHQESDERVYRTVEIEWSDTLDLDIGTAKAIRLLPDSTILVADGGYQTISRYNRRGALLQRFGAPGPGPGEFEDLRSVIPLSGGRIAGIDVYRRANVFGMDGLLRSGSLGSGSPNAVPFEDGFITISPLSSPMFRAYNDTLGRTASFGEPLFPLERGLFGVGAIVDGSSAEGAATILVTQFSGIMVAYHGNGTPKWSTRTIDPPRLSELRMDGAGLDAESVSQSVIALNGDSIRFYVLTMVPAAPEMDFSVDVYDIADGAYTYTMHHLSTECAYRDIRGDLGVQSCGDQRLILQKFSVTE